MMGPPGKAGLKGDRGHTGRKGQTGYPGNDTLINNRFVPLVLTRGHFHEKWTCHLL